MTSALVTGARGFVGTPLCVLLTGRHWSLVAGRNSAEPDAALSAVRHEHLPLSAEPQKWQAALRSIECVVHLAAHVHQMGRGGESAAQFHKVNVEGSRFVAEQCVRAGVKRLVFLSSVKVNGEGCGIRAYTADDLPHPEDAYARSKLAAELVIREVCEAGGVEWVTIRPPLVYGPGVRANFRRLMALADSGLPLPLGSIDNRRSLVGVQNLVDFIETCMTHPAAAGRVWLISDGDDLSTTQLMRKMTGLLGRPDRLFAFPPRLLRGIAALTGFGAEMRRLSDSLVVDPAPARERLGWRAPVSVAAGLVLTVEAYRAGRPR